MNQIMETIMSSFLPQTQGWRIDTPAGYWFIANAEETFTADTNFQDMSQGERIIKQKFNIKVPAYIVASSAPGVPFASKKYISPASISFDTNIAENNSTPVSQENVVQEPFLGSDDPTLPIGDKKVRSRSYDQRKLSSSQTFTGNTIPADDPALATVPRGSQPGNYTKIISTDSSGRQVEKYIRVVNKNQFTGETSYAPGTDLSDLI
jgi:hypothetical protein